MTEVPLNLFCSSSFSCRSWLSSLRMERSLLPSEPIWLRRSCSTCRLACRSAFNFLTSCSNLRQRHEQRNQTQRCLLQNTAHYGKCIKINEVESLLCPQLAGAYNQLVCSDSQPIAHSKARPQYWIYQLQSYNSINIIWNTIKLEGLTLYTNRRSL